MPTQKLAVAVEELPTAITPTLERPVELARLGRQTTKISADQPGIIKSPRGPYVWLIKPALDKMVAAAALVVLAIPLALVAVAVAISLGRPILFRQERVGKDGKVFTVLKFRTMKPSRRRAQVAVDNDRRLTHKSHTDPRLTHVGRTLRKWSLDELPQFVNVLRGDMSIVGPRPELPMIVDRYPAHLHQRHLVRPGLTGLWQISARGDGMMHENGGWDIEYVRKISFVTDLRVIVKTPSAMLGTHAGH